MTDRYAMAEFAEVLGGPVKALRSREGVVEPPPEHLFDGYGDFG